MLSYFLLVLLCAAGAEAARFLQSQFSVNLLLPPSVRLRFSEGESQLRADCEAASSSNFTWARDDTTGYQIATTLFQSIEHKPITLKDSAEAFLWFPFFSGEINVLKELANVANKNSHRLGSGLSAVATTWPQSPCPMLRISWKSRENPNARECLAVKDKNQDIESAVSETERWVEETLCKLKLCPYTSSLNGAAAGLESAKVSPGPVRVRHCLKNIRTKKAIEGVPSTFSAAAVLSSNFWQCVTELATIPEEKVATSLLVAPSVCDKDFREFVATCDELIEPSIKAVGADEIVGRAWFHPRYNSTDVGHSSILPGHAIPTKVVQHFITELSKDKESQPNLNLKDIQRGNDAVRWTPHATINLLRRSQLRIAKKVEAKQVNSKPNAIYVRNVFKMLEMETEKDGKKN